MVFNIVIRTASRVVPSANWASTGRQWQLHQRHSSALFIAVNSRVGELSRNQLQRSSPSFLHHYSTKSTKTRESTKTSSTKKDQVGQDLGKRKRRANTEACCSETNAAMDEMKAKMDEFENELSKIVGLDELKLQLQKWAKGILMDEKRRAIGIKVGSRRPPHMAFLGNPGTGKTMVARLLGKLLHMVGVLPTDELTEVQRTDLVGKHIGETGLKTRKKIEKAEGGILFVDEAYRLMPADSGKDFGIQALEEIMSVMDRGKLVVIFAGYSEPMERVISSNEGFRRRVTKFFQFDDFSCENLAKILRLKMSNPDKNSRLYGFKLHPSCSLDVVAAMIERKTTEKQRARTNGGLIDTMLANARENLDSRIDFECNDKNSLITITLDDLAAGLQSLKR